LIETPLDIKVLNELAEDARKLKKDFYSFSLDIQNFAIMVPKHIIPEECPGFAITFRGAEE
jgi:hypothetical protein